LDNECSFVPAIKSCPWGCENSACIDPCEDESIDCNENANRWCEENDGNVTAHWMVGECNSDTGACVYLSEATEDCNDYCKDGYCIGYDPDAGLTCNNPPLDYCFNDGGSALMAASLANALIAIQTMNAA